MIKNPPIKLILKDGTELKGYSFGYEKSIAGEIVFNTAMTGYPESLTDPSYKGQILVLTYPLIGNYGVPGNTFKGKVLEHFESDRIQISGLIISDYSFEYSHWNAKSSLAEWLIENEVPGIFGIDTRALTKLLSEKGTTLCKIHFDNKKVEWYDPNEEKLVEKVSIQEKEVYGDGKYKIILIDCGVKNNIIRCLLEFDTTVIRVPWNYNFTEEEYDGIFISNGPGDPKQCSDTINIISRCFADDTPIFGICLGNQLMALASGADTYKLKYGHRSHNQGVIKPGTNKAYITSQNHGYAIDSGTLSDEWNEYFININDKTNEGLIHKTKPFFSVQFHPEASGGPSDTKFLFSNFISYVKHWTKK